MRITRRTLVLGAPLLGVAGCTTVRPDIAALGPYISPQYAAMYAAIDTEPFPVPAVDLSRVDPVFLRQEVAYATQEHPGTIVVDPNQRYAYLVLPRGRALRYGVGVGREEGFNFQGEAIIARKAEWPRWTPTPNMIRREPERYGPYAGGLEGGADNPLGARALYLYRDGRDTLYRLHGTNEPWTIGTTVSSGCVRLLNQDIIDLYRRVPVNTKVVVRPTSSAATS
ncbi:L,D-transpeptidase [Pseudorhodoplanes sinuspersici]|uniref:L,D-transpeptidase n=1 Tax=Pseudorhodoplanes sinuspersici TaxID=1235591 RepID=A0A1W6ZWW8_9HYPH|nr:L,D-transpeptidase [Pseudorhodoplanes sinuspersici]ARQ01813.1 L,D-transpeptidase [Pseudorhodoplanes sinuspersici]RKE73567.1 lipoprotein-anchoring transpeptidase ErfK/SrfK [Pseudorhodoplanes sinuspersici]